MSWRRTVAACLAAIGWASPAAAQGTYVGAALTGDIVRLDHTETRGGRDVPDSGEAIGFALRVGTPLGSAWGVEAEFVRPAEIENEDSPEVIALDSPSIIRVGRGAPDVTPLIYPPISYRIRTSWRTSTFSTGAWASRDLSERVDLVFSGGVAFHRTEREMELSYELPPQLAELLPILPRSSVTESVAYSVRPFAGIGANIGMTEHLELVPAVRLYGLDGGVLVRPSIGLGWTF